MNDYPANGHEFSKPSDGPALGANAKIPTFSGADEATCIDGLPVSLRPTVTGPTDSG